MLMIRGSLSPLVSSHHLLSSSRIQCRVSTFLASTSAGSRHRGQQQLLVRVGSGVYIPS